MPWAGGEAEHALVEHHAQARGSGRKISTPSISTTTSAVSSMLPACTR